MDSITLKACGKINIGLDVTGRRDDGYHFVRMIMQSVDISDIVRISVPKKTEGNGIRLSCSNPEVPEGADNIAWRAAEKIIEKKKLNCPVDINIEKNIPMAAGMAGGSTDAAAVILGMDRLFGLKMSAEEMDGIALGLGADVPFCLRRGTYLSEGIGEKLTKLKDAPRCHVLVVNPQIPVSTKDVYRALDGTENSYHPDIDGICRAIENGNLYDMAGSMGNILEGALREILPEWKFIEEIKKDMLRMGALNAVMTGSGPTVFGLFDRTEKARDAEEAFISKKTGSVFLTEFV